MYFYLNKLVELPKKFVEEIVIVENEANEHEFKADCKIFWYIWIKYIYIYI